MAAAVAAVAGGGSGYHMAAGTAAEVGRSVGHCCMGFGDPRVGRGRYFSLAVRQSQKSYWGFQRQRGSIGLPLRGLSP